VSFYQSDPATHNIYLQDNVDNIQWNAGSQELLIAHLINYLREEFPLYKFSPTSSGTQINFSYMFPDDANLEVQAPVVLLQIKSDDHYQDSMGYVQGENNGEFLYGYRNNPLVEFDIWATSEREKRFIQGLLFNLLHGGIVNRQLRYRGIQAVEFRRSVPRGYDQTDRVLQFHTHIVGSDEIYRQLVEMNFTFDHRVGWASNSPHNPQGKVYAIREVKMESSGSAGQYEIVDAVKTQPFIMYIS